MLNSMNLKICPLLTLMITMVGCGKNVKDTKADALVTAQNQATSENIIVEFNGAPSFYTIPKNGITTLPEKIKIVKGSMGSKKATLIYNVLPEDHGIYEFKCDYTGNTGSADLYLSSCSDSYGGNFGDVSGAQFPMDAKKLIKMQVSGSGNTGIVLNTQFTFDWK